RPMRGSAAYPVAGRRRVIRPASTIAHDVHDVPVYHLTADDLLLEERGDRKVDDVELSRPRGYERRSPQVGDHAVVRCNVDPHVPEDGALLDHTSPHLKLQSVILDFPQIDDLRIREASRRRGGTGEDHV